MAKINEKKEENISKKFESMCPPRRSDCQRPEGPIARRRRGQSLRRGGRSRSNVCDVTVVISSKSFKGVSPLRHVSVIALSVLKVGGIYCKYRRGENVFIE